MANGNDNTGADSGLSAAAGSGKRLKFLRAMLDMMEGGDGLIGETEKSRAHKEEIRAEIYYLQNTEASR